MARTLAANVYVGETLYRAGTSPEKEIAEQITNPKAWGETEDAAEPAAPEPTPDPEPASPAKKTAAKRTAKKTAAK